jgi:hypothetical protein
MNTYDYDYDKLLKDLKNVYLIMQYPITTEEIIAHINEAYDDIYKNTKKKFKYLKSFYGENDEENEENEFEEVKDFFITAIKDFEDEHIDINLLDDYIYNYFTYSGSESSQNSESQKSESQNSESQKSESQKSLSKNSDFGSESMSQAGGSRKRKRKRKRKTRKGKIRKNNRNRTRIKYRQRKKINRKRTKKYYTRHFWK